MFNKLKPDLVINSVYQYDFNILREKNIKGIVFDIDNTLVAMKKRNIEQRTVDLLNNLVKEGFKVAIVSNASKERVEVFCNKLSCFYIYRAWKPGTKGLIKAIKNMELKPKETALVGDQLFTDVYGANKINMFSILVNPISKEELLTIRIKRIAENIVLYFLKIKRSS